MAAGRGERADAVEGQWLGIEAMAAAAVDLQVEEGGSNVVRRGVRSAECGVRSGRNRGDLGDAAVVAAEVEEFAGGVVAGTELHGERPELPLAA